MRIKSTLIKLFKREVDYDKNLKIYQNGAGNEYPEAIERYINNSVTAKQCANTMAVYLTGKGFTQNDFKVGINTLFQSFFKASSSVARQRGAFIHVNYNLNCKITSIDILPYSHCRIGKKDDNKYNGKIAVCEDWTNPKKNKVELIDVYNNNKDVILSQIKKCDGETDIDKIKNYKGQIYFLNLDFNTIYPYSTIDAVQKDCDSEAQASVYKNGSLRKGFFGKTLVITRPLVDAQPEDEDYAEQTNERQNFRKNMKSFIGVENTDGVMHLEMEFDDAEGIDKAILFKTIETNIDDKLFEFTEKSVKDNIRFAFNNIPAMLVMDKDGSMFGQSGDGIKQARIFYQEQVSLERTVLIQTFSMLMKNFEGFEGELIHQPLIQEDATNNQE